MVVIHARKKEIAMWEIHSSEKIRIKDIAERSGVSVGTVDRVLHNRPNVSKKARAKVDAVLKEINFQPNSYASALAYNRKYTFCCLLPACHSVKLQENCGKNNPTGWSSCP